MRQETGQDGALVQVATSAGFLIFTSSLWLFFTFMMRAGRNWARFVLTAFGAISVLATASSATMNGFTWEMTPDGIHYLLADITLVLLHTGAIALMFLPTSNSYFSATARTR